jgi:PGF-pre-PGF domain-containing protein
MAFVVLGLSVISMAMAAPPIITITAPASENQIINGTFTFIADVINTNENLGTVYFNFTNNSGPINSSENLVNQPAPFSYVLNTQALDDGNYIFTVTATNENITDNSSSATRNFTINNSQPDTAPPNYIPPTPILSSAQENFWINYTWHAGEGNVTDSYNVSVDGVWTNGTTSTYSNTTVLPHGWNNITAWAYNNSGSGSLSSEPAVQNTQLENNEPVQNPTGDKTINEGDLLTFTVSAADADYDTVTYGTNATEGTFNSTTGYFSWTPNYGNAGVYVWYFNSSDSYGGVASETITVTVNDVPLSITSSLPPNNPATIVGAPQRFEISLNRTANVAWHIEGYAVQNNVTVISASYTNFTAAIGVYNVTATASDGYDVNSKTWTWTVAPEPRYNVSGYVFDNYGAGLGGVQVQNGSNRNTTIASGYYLITGLLNGTYNFSYSKTGFDTSYLEVTIRGADNTSANMRIYDTAPPLSVSNPDSSTAVGSFFVNNSWVNPSEDFNHTWFRYSNGTDLENVSASGNNLNLTWQPHYTQNISAQTVDKYGNANQTKAWFNATIPNNPIQITAIQDSYSLTEGQTLLIDANYTDIDYDTGIFARNFTQGGFNPDTGILIWTTGDGDENTYHWQITVSDGNGSVDAKNFTVIIGNSTPGTPINLTASTGNFWVNYTWEKGANTDSFNVSYNGTWTNGSSATYINRSVGPHGWGNIMVYAWNNTLRILSSGASQNTQVPNNPAMLGNISSSYTVFENNPVSVYPTASDLDNDTLTFGSNAEKGTFYPNNGTFLWTPNSTEGGIAYNWYITVSDGYGTNTAYFTVTVIDSTPAMPINLTNKTAFGNFWVNYTWEKGANTDLFNVSYNGTWDNSSAATLINRYVGPHGWGNITVCSYNASSWQTTCGVLENTQVPNNPIIISNISDNYSLVEGQTLSIYANYTDADGSSDLRTFDSNFTNDNFNKTTGVLNWKTTEGDDTPGNYSWQIKATDIYGAVSAVNFIVHVGDSTPGVPINISIGTGNFWVNHTWEKGANTDSFNISQNGTWYNSSANFFNASAGPHGWSNISIAGYNNTLNAFSGFVPMNTQVPNNIPSIPAKVAPINWQNLSDGNVRLAWEKSTDEDGDNLTYDWQLSDQQDFSTTLQSGNTGNLNADLSLPPGAYYWRVRANDSSVISNWNQPSATPDFQVVSAPSIDNVRAIIISNSSIKIEWETNQSDSQNIVKYGYYPDLSDGSFSSWSNNTNNPYFEIGGLTAQSIYYQVFGYNASNSSSNSSSGIYNFSYPLQVNLYYIEPAITNDNETWRPASRGHIGKFIGIDGNFKNMGEDSLVLSITAINKDKYSGPFTLVLAKDDNKSFMETPIGRHAFEIDSNGVEGGFFNSTLQINVTGQNGTNFIFNYTTATTISLKLNPIFKIKRAIDGEGKEFGERRAIVSEGSTTTIRYILEANSSVNLTGVVIYDPFYPANQGGPFFNIQELKANEPKNVSYTYKATTRDLSSNKCEDLTPCLINLATFRGDIEPSGESIYDSDYVRIWVFPYITNSVSTSSGGGSVSGGGGGIPPSEDFKAIEQREVREMDIIAKSAATYVFKAAGPVMAVAFESSVSENGVPVALEVLKNKSKFIGVDAPGKLYKYFNVFVGTSGFSKKVSNGVVVFRVNNSWLEENDFDPKDINLYKWQGSEWIGKDTKIAESKPNYTYYASAVGNFSSFAITGTKKLKLASSSLTVPDIPMPADKSINESGNSTNLTSVNSSLEGKNGALKLGDVFIQFLRRLFSLIIG